MQKISEAELSRAVVALAELRGWRVFTISQTKAAGLRSHSAIGWPDFVGVRAERMLAWEFKSEKGRIRPGQREWLQALQKVEGCSTAFVRPVHWRNGWVQEQLK